jgi:transposase
VANRAQLQTIVDEMAPGLTQRRGVGAVTAAQLIVSFSHPGRCRIDAAFAALSGTSPLPPSSGKTVRHRLNRGGDRALNRAIHAIAFTRMRCCPMTKEYIVRRRAASRSSALPSQEGAQDQQPGSSGDTERSAPLATIAHTCP